MNIINTPWPYFYVDNFLSEQDFEYHCREALKLGEPTQEVDRKILDYDPLPKMQDHLKEFDHREYEELGVFCHYAVTAPNTIHDKHVEAEFKIMSSIVYLSPEVNHGTTLYDNNNKAYEIEWKPNRLFVFCGMNELTWHDYRSTDTRYTLNHFLVDPTKILNKEYLSHVVT